MVISSAVTPWAVTPPLSPTKGAIHSGAKKLGTAIVPSSTSQREPHAILLNASSVNFSLASTELNGYSHVSDFGAPLSTGASVVAGASVDDGSASSPPDEATIPPMMAITATIATIGPHFLTDLDPLDSELDELLDGCMTYPPCPDRAIAALDVPKYDSITIGCSRT